MGICCCLLARKLTATKPTCADRACIVGKQEVIRFLSVCPLLKRKRDEACYRCTMPGFGLGQVEMSIASMSDRPRQPDWNGNEKER
jgi:hypothetical protein